MSETVGRLRAVNVVHAIRPGAGRDTAIDKRPVAGPVAVGPLGLDGDTQCLRPGHGGPDKALYAYASRDAAWWAQQLARDVPPGLFGENLTIDGMDVTGALIGERWRLGDPASGVEVAVRMPRTPCDNLSHRLGLPGFHRRFAAAGRVGAYLAVVTTGEIRAGDPVAVEWRPDHGVTVGDWCAGRTADAAQRLLRSGVDLAEPVRRVARRLAARAG